MTMIAPGAMAPDFSLVDLNGQTITLSALRDKPLVLNFFHSGCAWCRSEMPKLAEIYTRHIDKADVAIIGIVVGEDTIESARQFATDKQLEFPIALDADRSVRQSYGLERVPTIIFIDDVGTVQCVYQGATEQLSGFVEQALLSSARGDELPELALVGNGCAP